jgi:tRNA threonylcarbamoyladenosine biosynthesis protein TsaB
VRILALEASTETSSVALMDGSAVIFRVRDSGRSQAADLLAWARSLLAQAGTALTGLDAIGASVGPGAFTGVRVSVAVAQGLAFGAGLPVVPIMTLESLAFRATRGLSAGGAATPAGGALLHALACLDARMGEVYWGCFAADERRGVSLEGRAGVGRPESVRLPAAADAPGLETRRYRGIGRGFSVHRGIAELPGVELRPEDAGVPPHAADLAALAALRMGAGEAVDPADLTPVYLRDKVAFTEAERAGK